MNADIHDQQGWSFRRDSLEQVLTIKLNPAHGYNNFETRMLEKGILGIKKNLTHEEGEHLVYSYALGECIPLSRWVVEGDGADWESITKLILKLIQIHEQVCSHMLVLERIWWSWDHLFYNRQTQEVFAIYLPQGGVKWIGGMTLQRMIVSLLESLDKQLSHSSSFADVSSFCRGPSYSIKGLQSLLKLHMEMGPIMDNPVNLEGRKVANKNKVIAKEEKGRRKGLKLKGPLIIIQLIAIMLTLLGSFAIINLTGDTTDALLGWVLIVWGVDGYLILRYSQVKEKKRAFTASGVDVSKDKKRIISSPIHETFQENHLENETLSSYDLKTELLCPVKAKPKFMVVHDRTGEVLALEREVYLLGRHQEKVDCVLSSVAVGRVHARIFLKGESYCLEDLNSKNGTYLNGVRLQSAEIWDLKIGDHMEFGDYPLTFQGFEITPGQRVL